MRAGSLLPALLVPCVVVGAASGCGKTAGPAAPAVPMTKPGTKTPMQPQVPPTDPARSRQLVLVTTTGWDAVEGTLRRYERKGSGAWRPAGEPVPVVVGKTGMGIGRGLLPLDTEGPVKKEGDGRAPAGIFAFGTAFGDEDRRDLALPYRKATEWLECVDDPESIHYNRIVDRGAVGVFDWKSSERMLREDGVYRLGVVVGHNAAPVEKGAGSCIFLHVWRGPGEGTLGCTAMEHARLDAVLRWLDPAADPVLVQLPEPVLERVRSSWGLP